MSFELEKIFGLAYEETLPLKELDVEKYRSFKKNLREKKKTSEQENYQKKMGIIGKFPAPKLLQETKHIH